MVANPDCPQQRNGVDCGVFSMECARAVARSENKHQPNFTTEQTDIPKVRAQLACDILLASEAETAADILEAEAETAADNLEVEQHPAQGPEHENLMSDSDREENYPPESEPGSSNADTMVAARSCMTQMTSQNTLETIPPATPKMTTSWGWLTMTKVTLSLLPSISPSAEPRELVYSLLGKISDLSSTGEV